MSTAMTSQPPDGPHSSPISPPPADGIIPVVLRSSPHWVGWKLVPRAGKKKPDKLPIDPRTGGMASTSNPDTWGDYDAAANAVTQYCLAGVGYVFTADDPFAGIDLDDCRNPNTGEIAAWAQNIISGLSSYSEVSPSKTGVKIIVQAKLPDNAKHNVEYETGSVEMYDQGRYFTVTGEHVAGTPKSIEDRQSELMALYRSVFTGARAAHENTASREPSRHNLLVTRAVQLHRQGLFLEEIEACLLADNSLLKNPKPENEVRDIALWISQNPQQAGKSKRTAPSAPPATRPPATPPPPQQCTMSGVDIAEGIFRTLNRFVVLTVAQACIVTLWVLHCHALDAADITPYLNIHSAEKGSGKTRLLEVLRLLVPQPWFTGSVSAAVLFRTIEEKAPTLLLDESDAVFGGDKEYAEALRGVLNTGNDRDGKASRCERQGNNFVSRDYATFCAKAIAGIGDRLPDTVRDRSVPIRLRRKAPDERVERFRRRKVEPELKPLAEQAAAWAFQNTESLRRAEPNLPDELSDRQQDAAEALLAIADAIGAEWSERARAALVELFASAAARDQSIGVQLLAAIRDLFQKAGDPGRLPSAALHEQLIEIEGTPWAEWKDGKPITKNGIAKLLKPYEIYSRCVREGKEVFKGYYMAAFADAWNRYLRADTLYPPSAIVTSLQPAKTQGEMQVCESLQESCVTTEKSEEEPLPERVVTTVTTAKGGIGKKRLTEVEI